MTHLPSSLASAATAARSILGDLVPRPHLLGEDVLAAWTLDKLGPLARGAEDCGLVLAAIAGADPADPTTGASFRYRERGTKSGRPGQRFRVGVLRDATAGGYAMIMTRAARFMGVLPWREMRRS